MSAIESAPPKAKLYPVVTIQITSLAIPTITPLGTNVLLLLFLVQKLMVFLVRELLERMAS